MKHEELTREIIAAFYQVYNCLGYGFLERVYEQAMMIELKNRGLTVHQQAPIHVFYQTEQVGEYFADLLIENAVIAELKAAEAISEKHEAQLLNYLKATNIEIGFVFNFGPKAEFTRKVYSNKPKSFQNPRQCA